MTFCLLEQLMTSLDLDKDQANILTITVTIKLIYFNNVRYYAWPQYESDSGYHADQIRCCSSCLLVVSALVMCSSIVEHLTYLTGLFYHSQY